MNQLLSNTWLAALVCLSILWARTATADHDWPWDPGEQWAGDGNPGCRAPVDLGLSGYVDRRLGLVVQCVPACSLAARLGLEPGDVIVRINGQRIRCEADYARGLAEAARCGVLRLVVLDVRTGGLVPISFRLPAGRVRRRPFVPAFPAPPWTPGVGLPWRGWEGASNLDGMPDINLTPDFQDMRAFGGRPFDGALDLAGGRNCGSAAPFGAGDSFGAGRPVGNAAAARGMAPVSGTRPFSDRALFGCFQNRSRFYSTQVPWGPDYAGEVPGGSW